MRRSLAFAVAGAAAVMLVPRWVVADGFAVRARPAGLDLLERLAPVALPPVLELPDLERELFDCPGLDILAQTRNGSAAITWHNLDFEVIGHRLVVDAEIDLTATTKLDIERAFACIGAITCDITASATPVSVSLELEVDMGPSGQMTFKNADVDLGLTPEGFDLQVDNCIIGSAAEWVTNASEGWLLDVVTEKVEQMAAETIAERLSGAVSDMVPLKIERGGLTIEAALRGITIDGGSGLTVLGDADVSFSGTFNDIPPTSPPTGVALPDNFGPGNFAVAASDELVTRALYAAWKGGVFSAKLADIAPSITLNQVGLAQRLGVPLGTEIDVAIALDAPPSVEFGRSGPGTVSVGFQKLHVEVKIQSPGAPVSTVEIDVDGRLDAEASVDTGLGALALVPKDLVIDRLEIVAGASRLTADSARLGDFVRMLAVPMLGQRLMRMPLAPALSPTQGLYLWIRALGADGGWIRLAADLVAADPSDRTQPETSLDGAPRVVAAGLGAVPVSGTDDKTPEPLLRFNAWLDGVLITPEPTFVHAIPISAEHGDHVLEVAAVDLTGNADASPVQHMLAVDGVAPILKVTVSPPPVVKRSIEAAWEATDDRDFIVSKWELRKVPRGEPVGELVDSAPFSGTRKDMKLDGLDGGALYTLTIIARDEAGNITSKEFGFTTEGGGCSVATTSGSGALVGFALVLALCLLGRRRHAGAVAAAAALAVIAGAGTAAAQGVGNNLSGPTDADGSSSFWNPASMFRGEGTRLDVGSGLSLVTINYDSVESGSSQAFTPKPEPTLGAYSDAIGGPWRVGFTLAVPQIDGAGWGRDDGASAITRYYAVSARNINATFTPSLAYAPADKLAIGLGVTLLHSRMNVTLDKDVGKQLNMSLGSSSPSSPFPYADPGLAAPVDIEASGWGVGLVGGALLRPTEQVTIGVGVHTPTTSHSKGKVGVEYAAAMRRFISDAVPGAQLPDIGGTIEVDTGLPLMAFTAIAFEPSDRWELRADYRYLDRSSIANTDLEVVEATTPDLGNSTIIRGYNDRHSVGVRGLRRFTRGQAGLRARYENNGVPDDMATPSNLDFSKLELGAVGQYALSERVLVTGQYSRFFLGTRDIQSSLHQPLAEPTLDAFNHPSPTGRYSGASNYLAASLSLLF